MSGALQLDTHAWIWSLLRDDLLSARARAAIVGADAVYVSPICFFEIGQTVRLGKWPEMEALAARLPELLREQGGIVAPLTAEICQLASLAEWPHRDPFDRLLAATCRLMDLPLVTRDPAFREMGIPVVW